MRLSVDFVIDVDGSVGGEVGLRNFTSDPDRAELGVWVDGAHRQSGIGLRSIVTATDWARDELGLAQVWCRTSPANEPAHRLFARAGWDRLGDLGEYVVWAG